MTPPLRSAQLDDINAIVEIHCRAFEGFMLTLLGERFLRILYAGFLRESEGVLLVSGEHRSQAKSDIADPGLTGFVAGARKPDAFFTRLRRKHAFAFALASIPALVKRPRPVMERLISAIKYRGDSLPTLPGFWLLSSLGVSPGAAGRGVGSALVAEFCRLADDAGASGVYLTTDAEANDSVRGFYERAGFTEHTRVARSNGRKMILFVRIFKK